MTSAALAREWAACRAMVTLCVRQRGSLGGSWLSSLSWLLVELLCVVGIGAGVAGVFGDKWRMLAWLWWSYLVASLIRQNHRTAYALVPRIRERTLTVMLVAWTVMTLVPALVLSLAAPAPLIVCAAMGTLLALTAAVKLHYMTLAAMVTLMFAPLVWDLLGRPFDLVLMLGSVNAATLAPAVILGCALLVRRGLGNGERLPEVPLSSLLASNHPGNGLYARFLRTDCHAARHSGLLMHALGPNGHGTAHAMLIGVMTGLLAPFFLFKSMALPIPVACALLVALVLATQVFAVHQLITAVYASAREQALVRLAAHTPQPALLNAALARALLLQLGRWWIVSTGAALGVLYAMGVETPVLLRLLAVFCMSLLAAGAVLRDFSHQRDVGRASKAAAWLWALLTLGLGFAAMLGAAVAFPAGRSA